MKRTQGRTVLLLQLIVTSVYASIPVPDDLNFFGGSSIPSVSLGDGFISNGVLWNLSPEEESSFPSKVPPPKINCTQEGLFPVTGTCHDYYYCQDLVSKGFEDWNVFWFTCQEGNVFDADSQKCIHRSLITGRPECQQEKQFISQEVDFHDDVLISEDSNKQEADADTQFAGEFPASRDFFEQNLDTDGSFGLSGGTHILNRKKRSVATLVAGTGPSHEKMVDVIAQSAYETCLNVKNIDNYVREINSRDSLWIPNNTEEFYTKILMQYNDNLHIAQRNTVSWKAENGILAAIEETFLLIAEFEPKFSERFQRMEKRVATVREINELRIKELEESLNETRHLITQTELVLQQTAGMKENEFVLKHLQDVFTEQREDHRRFTKEYNEARKEAEFQELTEILEYVKNNSVEIQEKVDDTKRKMEYFQRNTQTDSGNFNRALQLAGRGKQLLEERRVDNRKKMSEANNERENLRKDIERERNRISVLKSRLQASKQDLSREKARLDRQAAAGRDKQIAGGILTVIPVLGWIAGGVLLGVGTVEKNNAHDEIEAAVRNYEESLREHERQVRRLNNEISSADNRITILEEESIALQNELPHLERVDDSLQNLQDNVNSILPFLNDAIASLERMKEVFLETEQDLDTVIGEARKAHTSAQKGHASYFMYNTVDEKIKRHWENARDKIISVGDCVTTK